MNRTLVPVKIVCYAVFVKIFTKKALYYRLSSRLNKKLT